MKVWGEIYGGQLSMKALKLLAIVAACSAAVLAASVQAATNSFSLSNVDGTVNGDVSGTIVHPTNYLALSPDFQFYGNMNYEAVIALNQNINCEQIGKTI
jgi:hypothetical protein